MRLLHIMASDAQGGAETYSTDVMLALHAQGVEQRVIIGKTAPRHDELVRAGLHLVSWPLALPGRWLQRWAVRRVIARTKPDIVQCWMRRAAFLAGKAQPMGPHLVGWFGGYYDPDKFRNCTDLVGCTRDIARHMVKRGVPEARAHFIPTFPDIAEMPPLDRGSFATPRTAKIILALARLHPKKGLDTLLDALVMLPDAVLWLAGEGPLRRSLEAQARRLNIIDRVRFLGWRTDRAALLRAADVLAVPSRYEPFGTVILEAWAAATPLVACASIGPAAHIADGVNGLLTPVDDVPALAEAIWRVCDDPLLRERLVAQGYASYVRDYTREAVTRRWQDFYRSIGSQIE